MKVTIAKKFTLNRDDGSSVTFTPGTHDMEKSDAEHWFTGLHVEVPKAVEVEKDAKGKGAK